MRRFFITGADLAGSSLTITGEVHHHMAKVLRLKKGAEVLLADGLGKERTGVIDIMDAETISVVFKEPPPSTCSAPPLHITIYQGLPKGDKMDFVVQKATELGATAIIPFIAERSVKKIRPGRGNELVMRWQRIAREAARQSGYGLIPGISLAESLPEALQNSGHCLKLLLWEEERTVRLKETLAPLPMPGQVEIIIGPEGGITAAEAAKAVQSGFIPVSLGKRILRTESAALVILSILQFHWGDLGC